MLPLRLIRVVIEEPSGQQYDSSKNEINGLVHNTIYSYIHFIYKSDIDSISDANGYVLVKIDSDAKIIESEIINRK